MSEIRLQTGSQIPLDSLLDLYRAVGWTSYTSGERSRDLEKAFANSSFVVTAWDGEVLVGLARTLSDDLAILYLQDILVHPDYQRRGIGMQLMNACLERYAHVRAKVLMTDDDERQRLFYERAGFKSMQSLDNAALSMFVQIDGVTCSKGQDPTQSP